MQGNHRMEPMSSMGPTSRAGYAGSPFPPIAEYGFLSDCETTALVAPSGNVEWLCVPRVDSASVFGAILDRDAGGFRFGPADVQVPASRRYLPGTNVLETSWGTSTGWIIVRDVLLIGPWHEEEERSGTQRRAPTDYDAQHILLRTVRCVNGSVQLIMDCEPVFDYGRTFGSWAYSEAGYHQGKCSCASTEQQLTLTSDLNIGFEGPRAIARTMLKEGESRFVALSWGSVAPPRTSDDAYERLVWTAHHWQHWLARGHFPDHPWRRYLERSALTLKGLTLRSDRRVGGGGYHLAARDAGRRAELGLPLLLDPRRDLRPVGPVQPRLRLGGADFLYFIAEVAGSEDLQVMYGVGGERDLEERELTHLHGYEGARPVRIGNGAYKQRQHDMWGAMLDSVYLHTRSRDALDEAIWPILVKQVEQAITHWQEPDRGMWEVRGEPKHFTSSKVMCWVACDRGARLARLREDDEHVDRWQAAADQIKADVLAHGVDKRGVFTQHYDTDALDASLLLLPLVRFLPPDDERIVNTIHAIANELTEDSLVLRYRTDETDDGLSGKEGTFTICSFWLVSALVEIGELERARRLCERLLSFASPLDLYGEEIDPETGRHLGNFPQAFTHLALINAVMHVIHAEQSEATPAPLAPRTQEEDGSPPGPTAVDEMEVEPPLAVPRPWVGGNGSGNGGAVG